MRLCGERKGFKGKPSKPILVTQANCTEPLITHTYPLSKIDEAYELFKNKRDGVIKVAVECWFYVVSIGNEPCYNRGINSF